VDDLDVPAIGFGTAVPDHSPLPNVARVNARLGAEYRTTWRPRLAVRPWAATPYARKSILGIGDPLHKPQGRWTSVNVGGRIASGRRAMVIDVSNLLGVQGNRFAFGSPYTFLRADQLTPLRPRTLRIAYEVGF